MSKLDDIAAGIRAIKRIDLPLVNVPCSLLPDIPELMEQRKKDAEAAASRGAQSFQPPSRWACAYSLAKRLS